MSDAAQLDAPYVRATPVLLALQPPEVEDDQRTDAAPDWDWSTVFNVLESRLSGLRTWRYSWWAYWATLAKYLLPRRYHWLVTANLMTRGNPINQSIINGHAQIAVNICSTGMVDGLMPTTRKWFRFGVNAPGYQLGQADKIWLEDLEERCEIVMAQSNFYNTMAQCAEDEVVFGTAPVIIYEDAEDVIRAYAPCAGEYYLAASGRLSIDTLYREFTFTVQQIVDFFRLENCPPAVRSLWQVGGGSLEVEFVIGHAIEPNWAISPPGKSGMGPIEPVKGGYPFREIYWLKGNKTPRPLSVTGFWERPFAVARWKTTSNDAYGRSPAMDALGDVMQLQVATLRKAEAIEKVVRPPMVANIQMKNEPASILPGHITYSNMVDGQPGFRPAFEVKPDIAGLVADNQETANRIDRYFMVDVFQVINQMQGVQPRNELEISQRKGEALARLGPVIGLWKSEFAGPILYRIVQIMVRRGLTLPLPPTLRKLFATGAGAMKIEYMDMVTLAQLAAETAGIEQTFKFAGGMAEAAQTASEPNPLRAMDLDETLRIYAEKANFPQKAMRSAAQVAQMDAARARQAKMQQAVAAAPQLVQAAQGLSQIPVGGGQSALGMMTGLGVPAGAPGQGG